MAFFHELGHYETQKDFSSDDWASYNLLCDLIKSKSYPTSEDYALYLQSPVELAATKWACDYIVENANTIQEWWSQLQPLILNFYMVNNIVDEA